MPIFYVYERANGRFAGSGTSEINTDTHASTQTPPPDFDDESPEYDETAGTWVVPRAEALERLEQLEAASGVGGGSGQTGIAQRLDDMENRIAALENS